MKLSTKLILPFVLLLTAYAFADQTEKAPDFNLSDLDGNEISLENLKGNVIFINFWATWCPPCRQEIPGFIEIYEQYKDRGLVMLGVSLDKGGPDVVREFMKEYKITYPMAMVTQEIYNSYKPGQYIPATIIISRDGNLQDKHVGYLAKETVEEIFLKLSEEE